MWYVKMNSSQLIVGSKEARQVFIFTWNPRISWLAFAVAKKEWTCLRWWGDKKAAGKHILQHHSIHYHKYFIWYWPSSSTFLINNWILGREYVLGPFLSLQFVGMINKTFESLLIKFYIPKMIYLMGDNITSWQNNDKQIGFKWYQFFDSQRSRNLKGTQFLNFLVFLS